MKKLLKNEEKIMNFLNIDDPINVLSVYPYRYETNDLISFNEWKIDDKVFFNGKLLNKPTITFFNRRSIARFNVLYENNIIKCSIFNRNWITKLEVGTNINISGKYQGASKVSVINYNTNDIKDELGMFAIYSLSADITINNYRKFIKKVFNNYHDKIDDEMPPSIREKYKLLPKLTALKYIHFPNNQNEINLAIRTLKYYEFLNFHLSKLLLKQINYLNREKVIKNFDYDKVYQVANSLKFNLTSDQFNATKEILTDLNSPFIMNRILQGDVGSGKTIVAALAMYASVLANTQAAFMVPTEILAIQQEAYFKELFKPFDLNVVCLYSSLKSYKKQYVLDSIQDSSADIIIGTHSLFQEKTIFNNLGLVVIDEQHRFGVMQRESLFEKGINADQLLMSATPIPRTMASVLFSDMDISTIKQLPSERKPIISKVVNENSMKSILNEIIHHINNDNQIYVVCAAIEKSENSNLVDVNTIYKALNIELNEKLKLNINIAYIHGQLDSNEKELIMEDFKNRKYDILVSTTVIEVGINVKSANVMVIYDADSFGLSQLHQLRGRVGRGSKQGYTYFLSGSKNKEAIDKLNFLASTNDGFEISEYDLKLRGPGDVLGIRQSGIANFVLGDLSRDQTMLQYALSDAKEIIADQNKSENHAIIDSVKKQLIKNKLIES